MIVKTPSLEEHRGVTRLKQGDLGGMEPLVKCHQVQAVYAAYLIVQDLKLAEDIVQTAFLHAAQKIDQFDQSRPFGPWFLRIVINAAIKAVKQQNRFLPLDGNPDEDKDPLIDWLLEPGPGPDQVVETEETRRIVWKALAQLSVEQRAAVIMRHFLGMKESEMTQELDRPLTTVRWWLRTARSRMRNTLRSFWQADHERQD